jgi:hypothetical protein
MQVILSNQISQITYWQKLFEINVGHYMALILVDAASCCNPVPAWQHTR